jgi:hypothetical protein
VHLEGADLDLHRVALGPDHGGVERLVHVDLRHRDEILEAARHRLPQGVDHPEGAVAVPHGLRDHAHRGEIVDLVELAPALVHLLPDRIEVLGPAADARLDAHLPQLLLQEGDHLIDLGLALEAPLGHPPHQLLVGVGVHDAKGEVLQLRLDLRHAEAVGERRVDVQRLLGNLLGLLGRQVAERAHVVEAVGELDHEHADVARHRHHHLAEVLRLPLFPGGEGELADLGHPVHQLGDVRAELASEVVLGGLGVLEDVVEEASGDGRHIHLEVDEETGDLERMREIGLTGGALLA